MHLQVSIYINFPTKDLEGRELEMLEKKVSDGFIRIIIKITGNFWIALEATGGKRFHPISKGFLPEILVQPPGLTTKFKEN